MLELVLIETSYHIIEAMNTMKKLLFVTLFLHVAFLSPILANANDMPILKEAHQKIIEEFQRIDAAMKNAAHKLGILYVNHDFIFVVDRLIFFQSLVS